MWHGAALLFLTRACLPALPQDLKSENEGLWASLESHLSAEGGSAGGGSSSGGGRPNQYLAHLQAERQQLTDQLAAARQEHAEAASRLAAAQAAIAKLQAVVQRLSAAGGIEAGSELRGLLSPFPAGADSLPAAAPSPSAAAVSGGASGSGGFEAELQWQAEKRLLKAICKLALAVTMDQVGGRHDAAALADELAPLMAAHAAALQQLGLQKVWASLHRLAKAGGTGGTPSRGTPSQASAPPPAQQQQAQQQQVVPAAPTEQQAVQLPQDVWALQQRVRQYRAKCKELKVRVGGWHSRTALWLFGTGNGVLGMRATWSKVFFVKLEDAQLNQLPGPIHPCRPRWLAWRVRRHAGRRRRGRWSRAWRCCASGESAGPACIAVALRAGAALLDVLHDFEPSHITEAA